MSITVPDLPIRAFIVHCPGDPRREKNVARLLDFFKQVGFISVEVFDGVRPNDPGPFYSNGEQGSYLSQLAILDLVELEDLAAVMIIEDDTEPTATPEQFRAMVESALAIPSGWDTFHVGFTPYLQLRAWDPAIADNGVWRARGLVLGMFCYMISARANRPMAAFMRELADRDPKQGGGVGWDGGLSLYGWERPELVRLSLVKPMVLPLRGIRSTHRARSSVALIYERVLGVAERIRRRSSMTSTTRTAEAGMHS
jgi:hypothetical protein